MTESHFLLCVRAPYGPSHQGVQKLSRGEVYNIRNSMGSFDLGWKSAPENTVGNSIGSFDLGWKNAPADTVGNGIGSCDLGCAKWHGPCSGQ
jgi:hypothetical protein